MTATENIKRIFIVAGEASGDQLAANIIHKLKAIDPHLEFLGMGGQRMSAAGAKLIIDSSDMAIMGFTEVISHLGVIRSAMKAISKALESNPPDLLILIDYPGFNLRLAKIAKKLGCKILYYVSPQVWAWRKYRIKTIKKCVDHMAVLFPFEVDLYEKAGIPVSFVSHPLVETAVANKSLESMRQALNVGKSAHIIGLLPGSRKQEIERLFPIMLKAANKLSKRFPNTKFLIAKSDRIDYSFLNQYLEPYNLNYKIVDNDLYNYFQLCQAAIATSGTITFELGLLEIPMVIVYKVSALSYALAKPFVNVNNIGLCNIVAGQRIVKELVQSEVTSKSIFEEVSYILEDINYRNSMIHHLKRMKVKMKLSKVTTPIESVVLSMLNND